MYSILEQPPVTPLETELEGLRNATLAFVVLPTVFLGMVTLLVGITFGAGWSWWWAGAPVLWGAASGIVHWTWSTNLRRLLQADPIALERQRSITQQRSDVARLMASGIHEPTARALVHTEYQRHSEQAERAYREMERVVHPEQLN